MGAEGSRRAPEANPDSTLAEKRAEYTAALQGALATIAGSPYMKVVPCSNLGLRGDVIFGDFACYGIALSADVSIDMSEHYAFDKGLVTYRVMLWVGGKPLGESCFALLGDASGESSSSST